MKKIILTSAIILATVAGALAQTASATLNIKLMPVQSITVNTGNKEVNLVYETAANYAGGISQDQSDHLNVLSAGGFVVSVNSSLDQLTTTKGTGKTIESSGISVLASNGTGNDLGISSYEPVELSTQSKPFITSSKGGVDKKFTVTYSAAADNAYIDKLVKGTDANLATTYTTDVIYTIVPN